ncbi:MAG: hypothetical protein HN348_04480, partial [Proteobacteria bacterium]|nr:hypothetical protein [Pseudomonadota bacterium]
LKMLGAVDERGITALGRQMATMPLEPRLAGVVIAGHREGCLRYVATAAAIASERDPWPDREEGLLAKVEAVEQGRPGGRAVGRIRRVRDQLIAVARQVLGREGEGELADEPIVRALLAGFPDRVGQRRSSSSRRYRLASGGGAMLSNNCSPSKYILAMNMVASDHHREPIVRLAATVEPQWLESTESLLLRFDSDRESVVSERVEQWGVLVLSARNAPADPRAVADILAGEAAKNPRKALTFSAEVDHFLVRLRWLAHIRPELGLFDDWAALLADASLGRHSFAELRRIDLLSTLKNSLGWQHCQTLARLAPERFTLPSGSRRRLEYGQPGEPPILSARIQQLFGMVDTPLVAGVGVVIHLLAPSERPVQVTSNLRSFWSNTYGEVRKDLRGRYPKHFWPEDPLSAQPTDRAKSRNQ